MSHKFIGRITSGKLAERICTRFMSTPLDPRAQRSRAKILDAVRAILFKEGAEAVTHQHVAETAGVGRATVYRHWKSADEMVYALLDENPFRMLEAPSQEPLEERLAAWLTWMTELLVDPQRRAVILHVLSRTASDGRANRLRANRVAELAAHLDEAIGDTGRWATLTPARKLDGITMLVGPLMMRVLMLSSPPSRAAVDEVVQHFLAWLDRQAEGDTGTDAEDHA